jgi:two-component system, probable response regulator PhcQ
MSYSLLVVDDEDSVRNSLKRTLRNEDYEIIDRSSAEDGLKLLLERPVDIIISDHAMPGMTGIEFLRMARIHRPDSIRIILTGQADLEMAVRAINEDQLYRFLLKPWDQIDLRVMLRLAVRHLESERRTVRLLNLLRKQTAIIERLEREHPEVLQVDRDERGAILLTPEELALLEA